MIYVLVVTQLLTVVGVLLAVRWSIQYLERMDKLQSANTEEMMKFLGQFVKEHNTEVERILDQSFKEREYLIERIQHPEQTVAQAPGATGGTGISVVDEESEAKDEFPDDEEEAEEPTSIQPVAPLQPFPVGGNNGS